MLNLFGERWRFACAFCGTVVVYDIYNEADSVRWTSESVLGASGSVRLGSNKLFLKNSIEVPRYITQNLSENISMSLNSNAFILQ